MANHFTHQFQPGDHRFALIVSRYNRDITDRLQRGALQTLTEAQVDDSNIDIASVPGAWELAVTSKQLLASNKYSAVICLGAVIKGETSHDEHINRAVSNELARLSIEYQTPIALGLLTCNTYDQAEARAGGAVGNKGVESARAAIEMVGLFESINQKLYEPI